MCGIIKRIVTRFISVNLVTTIKAYSGSGAMSSPTSVAAHPSTAVKQVASESAAQGELMIAGNCNEIKIVMMTKHVTAKRVRLRGFCTKYFNGKVKDKVDNREKLESGKFTSKQMGSD